MDPKKTVVRLPPGRGTPLYRAGAALQVSIEGEGLEQALLVVGTEVRDGSSGDLPLTARVAPGQRYMVVNRSPTAPLGVVTTRDTEAPDEVVYDPYLHEGEAHASVDPDSFRADHASHVPPGYVDVLAKWYSIKFTYPDHNRIFVLPGWGISFQLHAQRTELWSIRAGTPTVIVGNRVAYDVPPGTRFTIPVGTLHAIVNPTAEVVFLEERYEGHFDEADITRVFNPNAYGV